MILRSPKRSHLHQKATAIVSVCVCMCACTLHVCVCVSILSPTARDTVSPMVINEEQRVGEEVV